MGDRELAEKVAKKLGWVCYSKGRDYHGGKFYCYDTDDQIHYAGDNGDLFSWPTVGLAIEDAGRRGWEINYQCGTVYFETSNNFQGHQAQSYDLDRHGDIKAILSAYVEIPDE